MSSSDLKMRFDGPWPLRVETQNPVPDHLVECCFSTLEQFRPVATRFEKTARNYLAVITLAAIILWLG